MSKTPAKLTIKVALTNNAAKDDTGTMTEDGGHCLVDVLANDPGSAQIWSLGQGDAAATKGIPSAASAKGGAISLQDGQVRYEPPSNFSWATDAGQITRSLNSLREGESFTDTFTYTVRMANGTLSTATVTIEITGSNDEAVFSGDTTGSVTEDGVLTTGGTLDVNDDDYEEGYFQAVSEDGTAAGTYGTFTFNAATGEWTYALNNGHAAVQALNGGEVLEDVLTVYSKDGTAQDITVTINGTDEPVVVDPDPVLNESIQFVVNKNNVNGPSALINKIDDDTWHISNFDSNDTLKAATGNITLYSTATGDFNSDGHTDTQVMYSYLDTGKGGTTKYVEVVLLGYGSLAADQLV